jgi:hypothetical protein
MKVPLICVLAGAPSGKRAEWQRGLIIGEQPMSSRMTLVVMVSAFAGLLVAITMREEAPDYRASVTPIEQPIDATNAMANALRKALEGDKSP